MVNFTKKKMVVDFDLCIAMSKFVADFSFCDTTFYILSGFQGPFKQLKFTSTYDA